MLGFENEDLGSSFATSNPKKVLGLTIFEDFEADQVAYTLRVNGSNLINYDDRESLSERFTFRWDSIEPDTAWQQYFTFVNVKNALDEAIVEHGGGLTTGQVNIQVDVKPFPWKNYALNIGAGIAAGNALEYNFCASSLCHIS